MLKMHAAVEVIRGHDIRSPAQAANQRQPLGGVVGVLHVEAGNRPAQRVLLLLALLEGRSAFPSGSPGSGRR